MKHLAIVFLSFLSAVTCQAQVPDAFAGLLSKDQMIKGELVEVEAPQEIVKYLAKVEAAKRKDPEWFEKYWKETKPGVPLPFHEKLGLTKEEYDEYLKLWDQREFRTIAEVVLQLKESKPGEWTIIATDQANAISTLRYLAKDDVFQSPNGKLARIADIDADRQSNLGAWKGREWKFEEETEWATTRENFAIGRQSDEKHGLIVYVMKEFSSQGTKIYENQLVIRFKLGQSGQKPPAAVKKPPTKKPK